MSESLVVHFGLQCQGSPPVLRAVGSGRSFGAFAAAREPPSRRGSVALLGARSCAACSALSGRPEVIAVLSGLG